MRVESSKGEAGPGQHEINFRFADALARRRRPRRLQERRQGDRAPGGLLDHLHGQAVPHRGRLLVPHPLEPLARRARTRSAADDAVFSAVPGRADRVRARAGDLLRADGQLVQALRRRELGADDARLGSRQPHVRLPGRRPRLVAARRDADSRRRRQPVPRVRGADRGGPARDRAGPRARRRRSRATRTSPTRSASRRRCGTRSRRSRRARWPAPPSATTSSTTTSTTRAPSSSCSTRSSPATSASASSSAASHGPDGPQPGHRGADRRARAGRGRGDRRGGRARARRRSRPGGPSRRRTGRGCCAALATLVEEHAEELARIESQNVGKPIAGARGEVGMVADVFHFYAGAVDKHHGADDPGRRRRRHDLPRAARRRRADRAVELPAQHRLLEARPRARLRQHRRAEAGRADAALGAATRRARRSRRASPRASSTSSSARAPSSGSGSSSTPTSPRSASPGRPRSAAP